MLTSEINHGQSLWYRKDPLEVTNLWNISVNIISNSQLSLSPLPNLNSLLKVNNSSWCCCSPCHSKKSPTQSSTANNHPQSLGCRKDHPEVTNLQNTSTNIVPTSQPLLSPFPALNIPLKINNSSSPHHNPSHSKKSSTQSPTFQHPCGNIIIDSLPAPMQMPNLPSPNYAD